MGRTRRKQNIKGRRTRSRMGGAALRDAMDAARTAEKKGELNVAIKKYQKVIEILDGFINTYDIYDPMQDKRLTAKEKKTDGPRLMEKWEGIKSNKKSREQWKKIKEDTEFKILELETDKVDAMNKLLDEEQENIARQSDQLAKETQALDVSSILGRELRGGARKRSRKRHRTSRWITSRPRRGVTARPRRVRHRLRNTLKRQARMKGMEGVARVATDAFFVEI
jgi:hypothetical protein